MCPELAMGECGRCDKGVQGELELVGPRGCCCPCPENEGLEDEGGENLFIWLSPCSSWEALQIDCPDVFSPEPIPEPIKEGKAIGLKLLFVKLEGEALGRWRPFISSCSRSSAVCGFGSAGG